jgi:hypothetical protein
MQCQRYYDYHHDVSMPPFVCRPGSALIINWQTISTADCRLATTATFSHHYSLDTIPLDTSHTHHHTHSTFTYYHHHHSPHPCTWHITNESAFSVFCFDYFFIHYSCLSLFCLSYLYCIVLLSFPLSLYSSITLCVWCCVLMSWCPRGHAGAAKFEKKTRTIKNAVSFPLSVYYLLFIHVSHRVLW